jgi:hypothetical protein
MAEVFQKKRKSHLESMKELLHPWYDWWVKMLKTEFSQ